MKHTGFFIVSLFFVAMLLSFPFNLSAQDVLIKVKKGGATLNGKELKESSAAVAMKSTESLSILSGSLTIARQDAIIVELASNKEYRYTDILALIKKKKQAASGDFVAVAFKDPIQKTNPTPLKGSSTRGNGVEDKPDFFYPYDNMLVADEKVAFIIGNAETTLLSKVVLKNAKTGAIVYEATPENNQFELSNLPEGDYEWTYKCSYYTTEEKVETDFKNVFSVPSEKAKKDLKKRIDAAKKNLKGFSPEMQEVLLLDYCVENNIYQRLN